MARHTASRTHPNYKHGHTSNGAHTKEYDAWYEMKRRCYDPKHISYEYYGGRGIRVHGPWRRSFLDFFLHVGRAKSVAHSLDRIDSCKDYKPGNVRWATRLEQNRNRRDNIRVMFRGKRRTLREVADKVGLPFESLRQRLKYNAHRMSIEEAIRLPFEGGSKWLTLDGIAHTQATWARLLGIAPQTLLDRIKKYKWPLRKELTTPKLR